MQYHEFAFPVDDSGKPFVIRFPMVPSTQAEIKPLADSIMGAVRDANASCRFGLTEATLDAMGEAFKMFLVRLYVSQRVGRSIEYRLARPMHRIGEKIRSLSRIAEGSVDA